ncbi:hypothetical protein Adi01nite_38110 [Amorphoplanes digitatis]|nr:hypothetical protein Adi01nite_38110 [Actinoplanes digitatis]
MAPHKGGDTGGRFTTYAYVTVTYATVSWVWRVSEVRRVGYPARSGGAGQFDGDAGELTRPSHVRSRFPARPAKTHNPSSVRRDVGDPCRGRSAAAGDGVLMGGIAAETDSIEEVTM